MPRAAGHQEADRVGPAPRQPRAEPGGDDVPERPRPTPNAALIRPERDRAVRDVARPTPAISTAAFAWSSRLVTSTIAPMPSSSRSPRRKREALAQRGDVAERLRPPAAAAGCALRGTSARDEHRRRRRSSPRRWPGRSPRSSPRSARRRAARRCSSRAAADAVEQPGAPFQRGAGVSPTPGSSTSRPASPAPRSAPATADERRAAPAMVQHAERRAGAGISPTSTPAPTSVAIAVRHAPMPVDQPARRGAWTSDVRRQLRPSRPGRCSVGLPVVVRTNQGRASSDIRVPSGGDADGGEQPDQPAPLSRVTPCVRLREREQLDLGDDRAGCRASASGRRRGSGSSSGEAAPRAAACAVLDASRSRCQSLSVQASAQLGAVVVVDGLDGVGEAEHAVAVVAGHRPQVLAAQSRGSRRSGACRSTWSGAPSGTTARASCPRSGILLDEAVRQQLAQVVARRPGRLAEVARQLGRRGRAVAAAAGRASAPAAGGPAPATRWCRAGRPGPGRNRTCCRRAPSDRTQMQRSFATFLCNFAPARHAGRV